MASSPLFVDNETIVLSREGIWLSNGEEISHASTVEAFRRALGRDSEGYFLRIGQDFKRIAVEDTAYFVRRIERTADGGVQLDLDGGHREALDPLTLTYRPGRLACRILAGTAEAKFLQPAYAEIMRNLEEDASGYYLTFGARRVDLGAK